MNNEYLGAAIQVVLIVGFAGVLFELYHYWRTKQKEPPAAPAATVNHIAAVSNEVKTLGAKLTQHMEALHAKLDKK